MGGAYRGEMQYQLSRGCIGVTAEAVELCAQCEGGGNIPVEDEVFYQVENEIRSVILKAEIDLVIENIGLPMNLHLA